MTTRDIQEIVQELYGVEVSATAEASFFGISAVPASSQIMLNILFIAL